MGSSRSSAPGWAAPLLLAVLALGLRLGAPAALNDVVPRAAGYDFYVEMADHLLAGEGLYRTLPYGHGDRHAIRTPVYPLVLAALRWSGFPLGLGVALLGALAGTLSVFLTQAIGRRWFGARAGFVAGLGVALWPAFVVHDTALQDTALYTALFLASVLLADRVARGDGGVRSAASQGVVSALAVLTRVTLLPTVVALAAWSLWRARGRRRVAVLALLLLGVGLAPWMLRNWRVVGAPVLTSDTGRSLWLGNNPQTFSVYPAQSIDRAEERAWAALTEAERAEVRGLSADELASDAWFRAHALAHVKAHPFAAVGGAFRKAWAAFSPRWNPEGSFVKRLVHAASYGPVALLAGIALWRGRRRLAELFPVIAAIGLHALQAGVFFGHSSYRLFLDPLLLVLASSVVVREFWPAAEAPA